MSPRLRLAAALTLLVALLGAFATVLLAFPEALASPEVTAPGAGGEDAAKWGLLAAALATGLSSLAAGYAVATVGAAAVGALAEKPELVGRLLILVGLAEGIAIYGLIVSILILNRLA
jgi:V/A-type H+-transporting ATPase subunit K